MQSHMAGCPAPPPLCSGLCQSTAVCTKPFFISPFISSGWQCQLVLSGCRYSQHIYMHVKQQEGKCAAMHRCSFRSCTTLRATKALALVVDLLN
jgi:hypothetical protein